MYLSLVPAALLTELWLALRDIIVISAMTHPSEMGKTKLSRTSIVWLYSILVYVNRTHTRQKCTRKSTSKPHFLPKYHDYLEKKLIAYLSPCSLVLSWCCRIVFYTLYLTIFWSLLVQQPVVIWCSSLNFTKPVKSLCSSQFLSRDVASSLAISRLCPGRLTERCSRR